MSDLLEKCKEYFDSDDFYEILKIDKGCTLKEIKKAYYKLSLLVHPDRVEESKKEVATEKFKILGKIHSILQDEDKRKVYNDTGSFDEDFPSTNWADYWRALFKTISTADIENFKNQYIGSDTEKYDIKRAYTNGKGSMDYILEMVPFSSCDDEPRIIEVVRTMVDDEEVEEISSFFNEPQKKKEKRRKKWDKEKREAEKLQISDSDIALEIQKQQEERSKRMGDFFSQLEEKYAPKSKKGTKRKSLKENGEPSTTRRTTRASRK